MGDTAEAMKAIAKDKTFLPHGILHSFAAGLSAEDTMKKLLREHGQYPTLVPRVDKDEIEFWYNSFKNGNFDLTQDPMDNQLSKLQRLPVLEDVIHLTNAVDQKSLRHVCKSIRSCIDTNERLYDNIEIALNAQGILVQASCVNTNQKNKSIYNKQDVGCAINTNGVQSKSESDYFTAAFADFKQTLQKNHTKVQEFVVKYSHRGVEEVDRVRFLSDATTVLSNLNQTLDVDKIDLMVKYPTELDGILKHLKTGNLKELYINDGESREEMFKISLAPNFFLHLQHLDKLWISTVPINVGIDTFVDIPAVFIGTMRLTSAELLQHKNKLLKLSSFRKARFDIGAARIAERETILEPFTPWHNTFDVEDPDADVENNVNGTIPFQDGSGDVLFFSIGNDAIFKRKKGDNSSY